MARVHDSATDCKLLYSSPAQNESALILLRSRLSAVSSRLGISSLKRENMLLVASELVSNNIKHAGGRGLIQIWQQPGPIIDIVALDYGPGISDLARAEQDGFSSANTLGKGLGTIRRLSDESYIYTQPETSGQSKKWSGTIFLARFRPDEAQAREAAPGFRIGLFCRSLSDVRHNGDRIYWVQQGNLLRWLHLDGLGHGEQANAATAHLAPHLSHGADPAGVLAGVNRQLAGTRGAVGVIGELDPSAEQVRLLGVGDMHAHLYGSAEMQHLSFPPGIMGREQRSTTQIESPFCKKCKVLTASDGIRRNWDVGNFAGLFNYHPQLIAYALGNIMGRISDDQSIWVASIG